uniref:Innexin n=1 Tax=Heterorhabditis bacteriophora TaxID=37862 RepID=A0A1I7WER9_HETBA
MNNDYVIDTVFKSTLVEKLDYIIEKTVWLCPDYDVIINYAFCTLVLVIILGSPFRTVFFLMNVAFNWMPTQD